MIITGSPIDSAFITNSNPNLCIIDEGGREYPIVGWEVAKYPWPKDGTVPELTADCVPVTLTSLERGLITIRDKNNEINYSEHGIPQKT